MARRTSSSLQHRTLETPQGLVDSLGRLLADTYLLYLKTHGYHWNVEGPRFPALHALFEAQYQSLWTAVDEIAERIRALGSIAPATYASFTRLTTLREDEEGARPDAETMLRTLLADHETVGKTARSVASAAEAEDDTGTLDLATRRILYHDKTAWMLRATSMGNP